MREVAAVLGVPLTLLLVRRVLRRISRLVDIRLDGHVAAALNDDEFAIWADQAIHITRDIPGPRPTVEQSGNPSRR